MQTMSKITSVHDGSIQCKLLNMAPPAARTVLAGTEYNTAEDLASALDQAMEKDIVSVASISADAPEPTLQLPPLGR